MVDSDEISKYSSNYHLQDYGRREKTTCTSPRLYVLCNRWERSISPKPYSKPIAPAGNGVATEVLRVSPGSLPVSAC